MRLATVEVIPYALPFRKPYATARGTLIRREMVLLRLRDEDGLVGLGEAVPLSLRGGATIEAVVGELQALGESGWLHQGVEAMAAAGEGLDVTAGLSAPARCAVATAVTDLLNRRDPGGRLSFVPLSGAKLNQSPTATPPAAIRCNATLVASEPAAVAADALRWAEAGFSTFKLKLGVGDDVGQVQAVREAVGPEARIRVDVNGAWGLDEAKRTLAELEPLDIELAEQPVETLAELAELARATSIPLAADESVESLADAERAVATGACACTGVKLSKVGGPEAVLAIADVLPAYLSSALDGPVGIAAAARVAQAVDAGRPRGARAAGPGVAGRWRPAHGLATQRLFAATIATVECELHGDRLRPPPGPGLGVEIDEEALAAHRL